MKDELQKLADQLARSVEPMADALMATLQQQLVCVLCGEPWEPAVKNRCECGGMCSWGYEKGGDPLSWDVDDQGNWSPKPPPN